VQLNRNYLFIILLLISIVANLIFIFNKFNTSKSTANSAAALYSDLAPVKPIIYKSTEFPTFKEWYTAVQKLPTYYALAAQGKLDWNYNTASNYKFSAFSKINNSSAGQSQGPYDFTELSNTLQAYFNLENTGTLSQAQYWVNNNLPPASFFDPTKAYFNITPTSTTAPFVQPKSAPFIPFVQRLSLPAGAKVILRGDIHGDCISLVNQIASLQQQGYMDKLDGFKLADKSYYMLFLGDYTDRGLYGAEVIYTILRLKLANPNQVFMTRGNHEDIVENRSDGFITELKTKFGAIDFTPVYRMYEFLPAAIYLGCGENYWQCCHGGLEIGYDPAQLLNHVDPSGAGADWIAFDLLGDLKQIKFLQQHDQTIGKYFKFYDPTCDCASDEDCDSCIVSDMDNDDNTSVKNNRRLLYPNIFADFTPISPMGLTGQVLGFMWNDFEVLDQSPDANLSTSDYMRAQFKQDPKSALIRSWGLRNMDNIYGSDEVFLGRLKNGRMFFSKQLTQAVLDAQNAGQSYKIRGIIRAHQHDISTKILMMDGMVKHNGVFGLWAPDNSTYTENNNTDNTKKISDYAVLTFCVAPDNIFGVGCKFSWDTFGILALEQDYTKCILTIDHTIVSTVPPVVPPKPAKKKLKSYKKPKNNLN